MVVYPGLVVLLGAMALAYWLPAYMARVTPKTSHDGFGQNQFSTDENGRIIGNFQDAEMWRVVSALQSNLLLPVYFEELALDRKRDGVTVAEMVAALQKAQQTRPLSAKEKDTLQMCLQLPKSAADGVIEWKGPTATFDVEHVSEAELFKVIAQNYPEYSIEKTSTGYAITPAAGGKLESLRAGPIHFRDESFAVVLKKLIPVAEAKGIMLNASMTYIGPSQVDHSGDFMKSKITLDMDNPTWLELATALAQATTPKSVWGGGEISGKVALTFYPMQ